MESVVSDYCSGSSLETLERLPMDGGSGWCMVRVPFHMQDVPVPEPEEWAIEFRPQGDMGCKISFLLVLLFVFGCKGETSFSLCSQS